MLTYLGKAKIGFVNRPIKLWVYKCNSCNRTFWTSKRITNKELEYRKCSLCEREDRKLISKIKKMINNIFNIKNKGEI